MSRTWRGGEPPGNPVRIDHVRYSRKWDIRTKRASIDAPSAMCPPIGRCCIGAKIAQAAAVRRTNNRVGRQRRGRRVRNRMAFSFSSEAAFAGIRVTHRHQKEAQPEGHPEDIKHGVLLSRLFPCRDGCALRHRRWRWIRNDKVLVAPSWRLPRSRICFRDGCCSNVIGK